MFGFDLCLYLERYCENESLKQAPIASKDFIKLNSNTLLIYALRQPDNKWAVVILGIIILGLYLTPLFYMPLSISVDDKHLNINRPLRTKSIPLTDIAEAKLCPPTIAARRICGSGGRFGWYGWFKKWPQIYARLHRCPRHLHPPPPLRTTYSFRLNNNAQPIRLICPI